ncbi:DUF502 domain-containing protein [Alkalimarinus coralli]|uniref:DUF502 domain-containing protein n=1 Tax=Alkalimarinus coralli TaxID=2935863 RepID=UPI00202B8089|nr:DUF502 domain-containing protein [Alkalimarinus coralli]
MGRIKKFVKTSLVGGILVLLPIVILVLLFNWAFNIVTNMIQPLTDLIIKNNGMPEVLGDMLAIMVIFLVCFVIGSIVSTGVGVLMHTHFDKYLARIAPGYRLIKEIVGQFFGDKASSPFANGEVARASIFGKGCGTTVTAIVTSRHADGFYTVFVPTGPNPTSGNMFHLPPEQVEVCPDIKVEDMMRTIIACGAGSGALFDSRIKDVSIGDQV